MAGCGCEVIWGGMAEGRDGPGAPAGVNSGLRSKSACWNLACT